MIRNTFIFAGLIVLVLLGAYWYGTQNHTTAINDNSSVRTLVTQFGATLQKVGLGETNARDQIANAYSPYATASLIAQWQNNIAFAPGKGLSGPWPDRIDVESMVEQPDGSYIVKGTVIEITEKEKTQGGVAAQYPVTMTIKKDGNQWLLTSYEPGAKVTSGQ